MQFVWFMFRPLWICYHSCKHKHSINEDSVHLLMGIKIPRAMSGHLVWDLGRDVMRKEIVFYNAFYINQKRWWPFVKCWGFFSSVQNWRISVSVARNSCDSTSFELSPGPHRSYCWFKCKTFFIRNIKVENILVDFYWFLSLQLS